MALLGELVHALLVYRVVTQADDERHPFLGVEANVANLADNIIFVVRVNVVSQGDHLRLSLNQNNPCSD